MIIMNMSILSLDRVAKGVTVTYHADFFFFSCFLASHADIIREDCVTSQKNVCVGGYGRLNY